MSKYLLEIGVEELPYKFIAQAQTQLETLFKDFFVNNAIEYKNIKTFGTPRRLTVIVDGLSDKQPDVNKKQKGPILNIALDENKKFTKAAIGFAAKNGVKAEDLVIEDNYVWAKIEQKGKNTTDILKENIERIVLSLQGPYFMRWADFDIKFQRPIRWIVSLYNDQELPVSIAKIQSSRFSRGHRFVSDHVEIKSIESYEEDLLAAKVIVDTEKRKQKIVSSAKAEAEKIGATVVCEEELLKEVTAINEWPIPVLCKFNEKYLEIPEKVIVTVMATHQRYFPVYKNGKLLNNFITMANFVGNDLDNIKAGNERVITARLDDARFFFNEDTQKPLADYIENLKGMTFQKGMGTVYDKTNRIVELSKYIAGKLGVLSPTIERTAQLCKADLATQLVFEFTELQGFIGADYALVSKELPSVALGIKEHYFPLNATSELPSTIEGQVVSIADKIDTIVAVFAGGKKPTGSQDPLGVRRAVLGIIKTVIQKNLKLDLDDLIEKSIDLLPVKVEDPTTLKQTVIEFFEQRLEVYYSDFEQNDVLDSCISGKNVLSDLQDFVTRIKIVNGIKKDSGFAKLNEGANRIIRILKSTSPVSATADPTLLQNEYEKKLYTKLSKFTEDMPYTELANSLLDLADDITAFFDNVLVMDENEKIKNNRINLLSALKNYFAKIADFSKLNG